MKTSESGFYAEKKFLQKTSQGGRETMFQAKPNFQTSQGSRKAMFQEKPREKQIKRKIFFSFLGVIAFVYKLKVS